MASAFLFHPRENRGSNLQITLLDWILILLGALIAFLAYAPNPEAYWH